MLRRVCLTCNTGQDISACVNGVTKHYVIIKRMGINNFRTSFKKTKLPLFLQNVPVIQTF